MLYVQTIFWLALFFSPFLSVFAPVYYFLDFYLRLVRVLGSWSSCKPTNTLRSSKFDLKYSCKLSKDEQPDSNIAFYLILFLVFLLVLIVNGLVFSV